MIDQALFEQLQGMRIEAEGAPLTFAAKLAQQTGWNRLRAERVCVEYRRFLYLAATSPGPVSPSKAVDEAWHLHLTYSRHYWDELCGRILGRPLHHDPGDGSDADEARHRDQYARTLDRYRRTFQAEPPVDIWGAAKPAELRPPLPRALTWTLAPASAAALLAACTATGSGGSNGSGEWIALAIIFPLMFVAIYFLARGNKKHGRRNHDGGGCGGSCGSDGWASSDSSSSSSDSGGSSCGGGGCGGGGGGD